MGRTGRAGNKGTAITFITPQEEQYAGDMVKALKQSKSPVPAELQAMADAFEAKVKDLVMPIEFGLDTMSHFIDWSRNVPFQVVRGEGECAV